MLFQIYLFFKYVLGASLYQLYVLFQIADLRYLSRSWILDPRDPPCWLTTFSTSHGTWFKTIPCPTKSAIFWIKNADLAAESSEYQLEVAALPRVKHEHYVCKTTWAHVFSMYLVHSRNSNVKALDRVCTKLKQTDDHTVTPKQKLHCHLG